MPFAVVIVAVILIVVAFNDTGGDLAKALESDIPGFFVWAFAIAAIAALGYIPGFKTPSRWLLGLVLLVIFIVNGAAIIAAFKSFASSGAGSTASGAAAAPANPTAAFTANPATTAEPTAAQIAGSSGGAAGSGTAIASAASTLAANPFNPSAYLGLAESGFGGLSHG
jgi:predicted lipid-binding transport protein (Tim44 family)